MWIIDKQIILKRSWNQFENDQRHNIVLSNDSAKMTNQIECFKGDLKFAISFKISLYINKKYTNKWSKITKYKLYLINELFYK